MKKIPTLFEREFQNHNVSGIKNIVKPSLEWVLNGEGVATVKVDGSCCAVIDGTFYKRFDAKKGRKIPAGAIPCCEPDPITGHHPHWVKVSDGAPADRWIIRAVCAYSDENGDVPDGTYEAVGEHFNGNPYKLAYDILVPHGKNVINVERTFEGIKKYLQENEIEGIVFWKDGEPKCKIKRSDFGFKWPVEGAKY